MPADAQTFHANTLSPNTLSPNTLSPNTLSNVKKGDRRGTARICVPVGVQQAGGLSQAVERAARVADIIELRLDHLDCLEPAKLSEAMREVPAILRQYPQPLIITLRAVDQGGRGDLQASHRKSFWRSFWSNQVLAESQSLYFADIELDLLEELSNEIQMDKSRVICSHHNFSGVPTDFEQIYERMKRTGARMVKIAVQANDITDCLTVFRLLERARQEEQETILIGMGEAGILTRVLAPSCGAFLTFGALDGRDATAPGQLNAADLRDLYRVHSIDEQTEITGIIGLPVAHSMSPQMHNAAYRAQAANAVYIPFEVHDVDEFVRRMVHPRTREMKWNLRGLSVTAPHKESIMKHLDWIEPSARAIGAVNTVVITGDKLYGYNTDAAAALAPLTREMIKLETARVAVIGAGGAARAVLWALQQAGAQTTVVARNIERAAKIAQKFAVNYLSLDESRLAGFDLVINTTPVGTRGHSEDQTPVTADQLRGVQVAYDLIYNPVETRFMREAHAAGCVSVGGLAMLVAQAAEQFKLWTGREAPGDVMHEAAENELKSRGGVNRE